MELSLTKAISRFFSRFRRRFRGMTRRLWGFGWGATETGAPRRPGLLDQSKNPPMILNATRYSRIKALCGVRRNPCLPEPATLIRMADVDLGAGLNDETRCHGTALPWHSLPVRFVLEGVGYCPFEAGPCFGRPAQLARSHCHQVSRSSFGNCIVDVTNIVADGRRVVPCT